MPDPISGMAAASVVGSVVSSGAAGKAASTQAASADRAAQLQNEQYLKGVELQEPFRQGGLQGQNRLMTLLGLGGTAQYDDSAYNKALQEYNARLAGIDPTQFMSGGYGGGYVGGSGGDGDNPTGLSYYQEPSGGTFNQAAYDAARAGIVAPDREKFRLTSGDVNDPMFGKYATAEYTPEMFAKGIDPGYQFRLKEGMQGLERSAAARGGLLSGGTLKGIQRYGQDMASTEYQNAFNRYQAERAGTLNPYQSLAGVGQSTANTLGTMGMNYANQAGELYQGAANARASGYVGAANALNQGIGGISNQYYQNQLLNTLRSPTQRAIAQFGAGNVYGPGGGGMVPASVTNYGDMW
jgi:hypothetical protein